MGLKQKTISSVIWAGIGTIGSGIIGMVVTMILARFLMPEDFGIIEVVLSIIMISEVFIDGGFSQAIIREKDISNKELIPIFTVNLSISIFFYCIIFFLAPIVVNYFSLQENAVVILRVLSTKLIIDSFAFTQQANCARLMQFRTLSKITIVSIIIAGILSIIAIKLSCGIWSLVVYYLTLSICKCGLINIKMKWKPAISFRLVSVKRFLSFGSDMILISVLDKIMTNTESLFIGKSYTKSQLGVFSQSRKFNSMVIENLISIVQRVTYPALSQIDSENRQKEGYIQIIQIIAFSIVPVAMFICFNSEIFMAVVFGNQWKIASPYLSMFSAFMLVYPIYNICFNVYLVKNKTKQLLYISTFKQILRLVAVIIAIRFGMLIFTAVIVFTQLVTSLILIYYSCRILSYSLFDLIKDIWMSYASALLCSIIIMLFNSVFHFSNIYVTFVLTGLMYVSLYLITSFMFRNKAIGILINIIKL